VCECVCECTRSARHIIIFCENGGKSRAVVLHQIFQKFGDRQMETIRKIQRNFGDDAMGITHIKKCYNRFEYGRTSVESDARACRPSTSRNDELTDQVRTFVMQDRRVTVREVAEEVGL